jgi:CelD/BcsL family acetyltransferase involved in cellulose biosynthesis
MLVTQWKELASRALVQNIFYEPEFALPASIPFGEGVELLVVTTEVSPLSRMVGLWPVRRSRRRWGLPVSVLVGWTHPYAPSGVPLLDREQAANALGVLLRAGELFRDLPRRAFLSNIPDEGPFAELLSSLASTQNLRSQAFNQHTRAKLDAQPNDKYFDKTLSSRTQSKLRQELRRIHREGQVSFETIVEPQAVNEAIEDYIALEGRGWKGRTGTAISCSPQESEFLRRTAQALSGDGRIRIHRLRLNGSTLASSVTFLSPSMAWYAKISYDESQAKNSPGSHLVMHATEEFLRDPALDWADSCAPPDHPLMRKFWGESLLIANRLVDGTGRDRLFKLSLQLEHMRLKVSHAWNAFRERRHARLRHG